MPAVLLIFIDQPYFGLFIPIFQFGLFFLALFMGASLFSGFRKQKDIESLLTLPYSRLQLISLKMLPKFSALLFFFVIYLILSVLGADYYEALSFVSFTVIYFSLFLIALSFSANSDNFIVVFSTSLLFFIVFFGLYILEVTVTPAIQVLNAYLILSSLTPKSSDSFLPVIFFFLKASRARLINRLEGTVRLLFFICFSSRAVSPRKSSS